MSGSNIITINRRESHNYNVNDLYHSSFFEIAMNSINKIKKEKYDIFLNYLSPILSLKFYESNKEKSLQLINQYIEVKIEEAEYVKNMPDEASKLDHVFRYYFKQFQIDKEIYGYEEALDKNQDFYFLCESLYMSLPCSFVFSLINLKEIVL